MGYYIRVLSTKANCIPLARLRSCLKQEKFSAKLSTDDSASANWTNLVLSHSNGREIAAIERNRVSKGSLGAEELEELAEEIADCKPVSAVQWLRGFLPRVRCIYAFQVLSGTEHKNGREILGAVKNCIWSFAPSIIQADSEGFSNKEGYHILWQFADSVDGTWWMGVLRDDQWVHFQMDLGNRKHRKAFFEGKVPAGVKLAPTSDDD